MLEGLESNLRGAEGWLAKTSTQGLGQSLGWEEFAMAA